MKKNRFLPFLALLLLFSCGNTKSSNLSSSSVDNSSFNSSSELPTLISDFVFQDNEDQTLSIKKYNNSKPKRVVLPNEYKGKKITGILDYAFLSSGGIETIVISDNIKDIASKAFDSCLTITSFEVSNNNPYFMAKDDILYSKDGTELMCCPTKIDNVVVKQNVKKIHDGAFSYYRGTKITLNEGLLEIGESAFFNSSNLDSLTIPNSVKDIKSSAFNLSGIKTIQIGTGISKLSAYTFMKCPNLTELKIPGNVKVIEKDAIRDNTKLKTLTFEEGVEILEGGSCVDNTITSLTLPKSLKSIGENAFIRNRSLEEVSIPEGVKSIGNGVFSYCESLKKISISSTVEEIGYSLLAYDKNLKTIEVSENNQYFKVVDNVLYSKDASRLLVFPSYNEKTSYQVMDNVKKIDREAFSYLVKLESLTIPNSINFIGANAFKASSKIKELQYLGTKDEFKKIIYKEKINEIETTCFEGSYIEKIKCSNGDLNVNEL